MGTNLSLIQQFRSNGRQQRALAASVAFPEGPGTRDEVSRRGGSGETREKRRETRLGLPYFQLSAEPQKRNSAQSREPLIWPNGRAAPGAEPSRATRGPGKKLLKMNVQATSKVFADGRRPFPSSEISVFSNSEHSLIRFHDLLPKSEK